MLKLSVGSAGPYRLAAVYSYGPMDRQDPIASLQHDPKIVRALHARLDVLHCGLSEATELQAAVRSAQLFGFRAALNSSTERAAIDDDMCFLRCDTRSCV